MTAWLSLAKAAKRSIHPGFSVKVFPANVRLPSKKARVWLFVDSITLGKK